MPSSASPDDFSPPWTELPLDLTENILQRLGSEEILQSAQFVCATWWKVCLNPYMWRVIKFVHRDCYSRTKFSMMCRHAVDLSQGQLIDLTIVYFCHYSLLDYIADRSSHLQRLTLVSCSEEPAFIPNEAVKKLHELEELNLIFATIKPEDIEAIGNNCPMLKSFTFNFLQDRDLRVIAWLYPGGNALALAIAKTMPNLYHLRLLDNELDNEGLQAILDGCPRLESLDLRHCSMVDLGGPLGKRCGEQIKHLKLPSDGSIADYEWGVINGENFTFGPTRSFTVLFPKVSIVVLFSVLLSIMVLFVSQLSILVPKS